MRRKNNYHVELVDKPENLRRFIGWEIRNTHGKNKPGFILQNPDSGEKIKIIVDRVCFKQGHIKLGFCRTELTHKKEAKKICQKGRPKG